MCNYKQTSLFTFEANHSCLGKPLLLHIHFNLFDTIKYSTIECISFYTFLYSKEKQCFFVSLYSLLSFLPYYHSLPREMEASSDVVDIACSVSCLCPISFSKVCIPVRGKRCRHLQFFDKSSFLEVSNIM